MLVSTYQYICLPVLHTFGFIYSRHNVMQFIIPLLRLNVFSLSIIRILSMLNRVFQTEQVHNRREYNARLGKVFIWGVVKGQLKVKSNRPCGVCVPYTLNIAFHERLGRVCQLNEVLVRLVVLQSCHSILSHVLDLSRFDCPVVISLSDIPGTF